MILGKASAVALAVGIVATGLAVTTDPVGAFVYTCGAGDGVGRRPRSALVRRRESLIRSEGRCCDEDKDGDGRDRSRWSPSCRTSTTRMGLLGRGRRGTERESLSSPTTTTSTRDGNINSDSSSDSDKDNSIEEACAGGERDGERHDMITKPKQETLRGGVTRATASASEQLRPPSREGGGRRLAAEETDISTEAVGREKESEVGGNGGDGGGDSAPTTRQTYAEAALRRLKRARGALEEALDELGRSSVDELGLAPPAYMDLHFPFPPSGEASGGEEEGVTGREELERGRVGKGAEKGSVGWLRQWKKRGVIPPTMGEIVGEKLEALDERVERARASVETALNELGLAVPFDPRRGDGGTEVGRSVSESGIKSLTQTGSTAPGGTSRRWWLPERLRARLEELDAATNASSTEATAAAAAAFDLQEGVNATTWTGASGDTVGDSQRDRDLGKFFRRSLPMPLPSIQSQRAVAERAVKRAKNALGTAIDDLGLIRPPVGSTLERFLHADEVVGLWRQEEALEDSLPNGDDVLPGTDIGPPERRIWVVTTAALPWMTGTSVNPLLRAAYLTRDREPGKVTLMIPWLTPEDQAFVLPEGKRFDTREGQEAFIREWLGKAGMGDEASELRIAWYDARYHQLAGCIFPMGDMTRLIPDEEADVCILEEPEHLNWFRASGSNWSKKFTHVVGVIHTNYIHYTTADTSHWASGRVKAPFARAFNKVMARAYCDKVIKLSATLQRFAEEKETVANVHGVRENFLIVGDERKQAFARGEPFPEGNRPYFLGKMLWEKGYDRLWDLLKGFQDAEVSSEEGGGRTAEDGGFVLSAYGSGPDDEAICQRARDMGLAVEFYPATDHAELSQYKTFVNPSESEVLCTTVAEALAMGKFVIIAEHASNEFFYQFPNTLRFKNQAEFNKQLKFSIENDPAPLTAEQRYVLGWEAATKRLIESAKVTVKEARRRRRELDEAAWLFHYYLGSGRRGDRVRKIMAGGVAAGQYAHMELVLKVEEEAQHESKEFDAAAEAASFSGGTMANPGAPKTEEAHTGA